MEHIHQIKLISKVLVFLILSNVNSIQSQGLITRSLPDLSYTELIPHCGSLDGTSFYIQIAKTRNDGNPPLYLVMFYSTEQFNKFKNRGETISQAFGSASMGLVSGHRCSDPFILDINLDNVDNPIFTFKNANNTSKIYATYSIKLVYGSIMVNEKLSNGKSTNYSISQEEDREDLFVLKLFTSIYHKSWIDQEYGNSKQQLIICLKNLNLLN